MIPEALAARVERIANLSDARVEDYRGLREKDLAARRRAFIVESEVVLRVMLARCRYPIRSLFIAEKRLSKLTEAIAALSSEIPVYVGEQTVLNSVAGFPIHRGILAAGERTPLPEVHTLLARTAVSPSRIVILEGLTNHDNVGGVFRNAAAFGAGAVLIDRATCDPLYRKSIRVSVGGALFVPFARADTSGELIAAARRAGYHMYALSPRRDAVGVTSLGDLPERAALLLGTEGRGLSNEAMAAADVLLRVEMAADFDSLNVATCSGIALHAIVAAQRSFRS